MVQPPPRAAAKGGWRAARLATRVAQCRRLHAAAQRPDGGSRDRQLPARPPAGTRACRRSSSLIRLRARASRAHRAATSSLLRRRSRPAQPAAAPRSVQLTNLDEQINAAARTR